MSDLQCPARLLVVRHAEAGDDAGPVALADEQAKARIVRVWTSPAPAALMTAEVVADRLGTGIEVREDLREVAAGGEDVTEVATRVAAVLGEAADLHRGEAVLVVSHGAAISATLALLVHDLGRGSGPIESCGGVELEGDADGWVVRGWVERPGAGGR